MDNGGRDACRVRGAARRKLVLPVDMMDRNIVAETHDPLQCAILHQVISVGEAAGNRGYVDRALPDA
jgi:hypothetical protein